jgi:glycosyltransferase involved in cell wall biosynthesis
VEGLEMKNKLESLLISVIMLTYNRENMLSRAIECILSQVFTNFEFIIINNGSTDESGNIADEYAARDNRIRVIHRQRGNIGSGRNTGLDAVKGDYIAFIDDDDWCESDFLLFLYNLAVENDADISICGAMDKVFDEKIIMSAEESIIELMWRKRYNMAFPTKMFRREIMENLRFPEEGMFDDITLMYRSLALANRVAYHGLPKYTFYRHENNNSAWTTNHALLTTKTLDEYLEAYRTRTMWLCEKFPNSAYAWRYFEWSFMLSMVEKIIKYEIKNCERQAEILKNNLAHIQSEFLSNSFIQDFEKIWMRRYVL